MIKSLLAWLGLRKDDLSVEQEFLLAFSGLTIVAILPFSLIRFSSGEWLIGLVDLFMVLGATSSSLYALKQGKARLMSLVFVLVLGVGLVVSIALQGKALIYWCYPATAATYFVLRAREAIVINLLILISCFTVVYQDMQWFEASTFAITFSLVALFSFLFSSRSAQEKKVLSEQALRDALTSAANRRALDDDLEAMVSSAEGQLLPSVLLIFDIDYFKQINDQFGHEVGDQFLIKFVDFLRSLLQPDEKLYRLGGEEFVVIVQGELDNAVALAEQVRSLLEQTPLVRNHIATVSIGVAERTSMDSTREWMKRADDALYKAKSSGRNQVQVADTPDWKDEVDRLLE